MGEGLGGLGGGGRGEGESLGRVICLGEDYCFSWLGGFMCEDGI